MCLTTSLSDCLLELNVVEIYMTRKKHFCYKKTFEETSYFSSNILSHEFVSFESKNCVFPASTCHTGTKTTGYVDFWTLKRRKQVEFFCAGSSYSTKEQESWNITWIIHRFYTMICRLFHISKRSQ